MRQTCSQLLTTTFSLALLLAVQTLFANPSLALADLLDKNGRIDNPFHLSGTVDFSGFYPILDDRAGLVFLPVVPPAPGSRLECPRRRAEPPGLYHRRFGQRRICRGLVHQCRGQYQR